MAPGATWGRRLIRGPPGLPGPPGPTKTKRRAPREPRWGTRDCLRIGARLGDLQTSARDKLSRADVWTFPAQQVNSLGVFTVSCMDMIVNVFAHVNDTCEMPTPFDSLCKAGATDLVKLLHFRGELTICLMKDAIVSKPIVEFAANADHDATAIHASTVH
eukprot:397884-Pyramimonas_sp.AAC.1